MTVERKLALLRGVNVSGAGRLPMADLRAALGRAGYVEVQTYIQSGNVIFASDASEAEDAVQIGALIADLFGFHPPVMVLNQTALQEALAGMPFPEGDEKTVHLFFLSAPAHEGAGEKLDALRAGREQYLLTPSVLYLHAPDGAGRSKLLARAETALGCPVTARNLRTMRKLAAMMDIG